MYCGHYRPARVADQASELSRDDILQHGLVQAEISYQALELGVLLLELAQPLHLRWQQPGVFLTPIIVRCLADPRLPAHLADRRALFRLLQDEGDLRLCFRTKAIYASLNFDLFMSVLRLPARS